LDQARPRGHRAAVRTALIAVALLALAACEDKQDPAARAKRDAAAIAQVEAAQDTKPPIEPIHPAPIPFAEVQRYGMLGAGCAFTADDAPGDPVLIARPQRAALKVGARLTMYASDPGSAPLPLGAWTHYVGKTHSIMVEALAGEAKADGNSVDRRKRLVVRDRWDRIVYAAPGSLSCGD
jgi:hypothetical protein